jgi:hypothetical protein
VVVLRRGKHRSQRARLSRASTQIKHHKASIQPRLRSTSIQPRGERNKGFRIPPSQRKVMVW